MCVVNEWWIRAQVLLSMGMSAWEEEQLEKNPDRDEVMMVHAYWCFEDRNERTSSVACANFKRFFKQRRLKTLRSIFSVMVKQTEIGHTLKGLGF